jgi:hypothetical protein
MMQNRSVVYSAPFMVEARRAGHHRHDVELGRDAMSWRSTDRQ